MFNSIIPTVYAHDDDQLSHGMMGYSDWGVGGIFMMGFSWIFVIAIIIVIIQYIVKNQNQVKGRNGRTALEILKERYAKGELEKKEFEEMKKALSK